MHALEAWVVCMLAKAVLLVLPEPRCGVSGTKSISLCRHAAFNQRVSQVIIA